MLTVSATPFALVATTCLFAASPANVNGLGVSLFNVFTALMGADVP